jgi:ABC-2 type transport system ATP-binding protein
MKEKRNERPRGSLQLYPILGKVHTGGNERTGFAVFSSVITAVMAAATVSVEALEKYFPPSLSGWRALLQPVMRPTKRALAGVSFELAAGQAVALAGPNGAGKTTLLRILATLLLPTRGRVMIGGFDAARQPAQARRQFGYHTSGDEGFYGRLTGRENLIFFAAMNNITGADARSRIARVAQWIGIDSQLDEQVRTYSTGFAHRLALARALLHDPQILLLDEPTRSLDPVAAADFRSLLKKEIVGRRGTTLLFASHAPAEIDDIADRLILLNEGRMVANDRPQTLRAATGAPTTEAAIAQLIRRPLAAARS